MEAAQSQEAAGLAAVAHPAPVAATPTGGFTVRGRWPCTVDRRCGLRPWTWGATPFTCWSPTPTRTAPSSRWLVTRRCCGSAASWRPPGRSATAAHAAVETVVRRFRALAESLGVEEMVACATAALRDARDSAAVVDRIEAGDGRQGQGHQRPGGGPADLRCGAGQRRHRTRAGPGARPRRRQPRADGRRRPADGLVDQPQARCRSSHRRPGPRRSAHRRRPPADRPRRHHRGRAGPARHRQASARGSPSAAAAPWRR